MNISCYYHAVSAFQIREFPNDLKRKLARRARTNNLTMSDYALAVLREALGRPDPMELRDRLRKLAPVDLGIPAADLLEECRHESRLVSARR